MQSSVSVLALLCGLGVVTLCGIVCLLLMAVSNKKRTRIQQDREQQKQIVERINAA